MSENSSTTTLKDLLNARTITRKQFKTAMNATKVSMANFDGNLWATIDGQRQLIDRKGKILFDGKKITR